MDMQIVRRGTPPPPPPPPPWGDDIPYYWEGQEFTGVTGGWVEGIKELSGTMSKESDHLFTRVSGNTGSRATRFYATGNKIDFTNISTLYIDWASEVNTDQFSDTRLQNVNNDYVSAVVFVSIRDGFSRKVDVLDVSGVTGEYYICVGVADGSTSTGHTVENKIFKVWGEE